MKTITILLMMIWVLPTTAQLFDETPNEKHRFTHVNLSKLRKDVIDQLLKDDLINNKKPEVFLFLKEGGIELNRMKLSPALNQQYVAMLSKYELGEGPNRMVLINPDCTAVGDFLGQSFSGKSIGRLSLPEVREAMDALE